MKGAICPVLLAKGNMAELAKVIRLERRGIGDGGSITVDGEDFPWHVALGPTLTVDADGLPAVTITLLAERVEVTNDIDPE